MICKESTDLKSIIMSARTLPFLQNEAQRMNWCFHSHQMSTFCFSVFFGNQHKNIPFNFTMPHCNYKIPFLMRIAVYLDGRISSRGHIRTFHLERSPSPSHLPVLYSFLIFPFIHQHTPIPLNFPSSFATRIYHCTFHT